MRKKVKKKEKEKKNNGKKKSKKKKEGKEKEEAPTPLLKKDITGKKQTLINIINMKPRCLENVNSGILPSLVFVTNSYTISKEGMSKINHQHTNKLQHS